MNSADELIGPYGASLGSGGFLGENFLPANHEGTTTNAISDDGSKLFFESPPAGAEDLPEGVVPHLYMRNEGDHTTTPLDNPASSGSARYQGASADGSLVFFTSNEGLDGSSKREELYEFNTTGAAIGPAPAMSAIPVSGGNAGSQPATTLTAEASAGTLKISVASTAGFLAGRSVTVGGEVAVIESVPDGTHLKLTGALAKSHAPGAAVVQQTDGIIGESAISNDGAHVYFVANSLLAANANSHGQTAAVDQPNLYVYDTATGLATFIATLAWPDVNDCESTCALGHSSGLVAEPDIARPAVPTPDGTVLVFASGGDLTGEDSSPATTLTAAASPGDHTLTVESTAGFLPGQTITIDAGGSEELAGVESVDSATQLTLTEHEPSGVNGLVEEHAEGASVRQLHSEIYRYDTKEGSLVCISCTAAGVTPTGSATLGNSGGGSYAPPGQATPMDEHGTRIFFQTPDPLVAEDVNGGTFPGGSFGATSQTTDVYEWENGTVSLVSDGHSTTGASLDGTTPSGDDVFFTTRADLLPADADGYDDIYDARVGGGFPESRTSTAPCAQQGCRSQGGSTVFFSVPASSTLLGAGNSGAQHVTGPIFTVGKITGAQRAALMRTGRLTLSVTATAAGRVAATAVTRLHGRTQRVAYASTAIARGGTTVLTLRLSQAVRKALARSRKPLLRIEVSYSASASVKVAELTLGMRGRASVDLTAAHTSSRAPAGRRRAPGA